MEITRKLSNGDVLTIKEENGFYRAKVKSDTANQGFDGDQGEIKEGETLEGIADEIETWLEDNINS